jgi:hypothetical protein
MPETCIHGKARDGKVIGGVFGSLALALGYHFGLPGKTRTVSSAFAFLSIFKCSKCTSLPKYGCGVGLELRVTLDHLTQFLLSIWRSVVLLSHHSIVAPCCLSYLFFLLLTMISQSRRHDRSPSHRRYVLGLHHCYEEEPSTELRPATQQHP